MPAVVAATSGLRRDQRPSALPGSSAAPGSGARRETGRGHHAARPRLHSAAPAPWPSPSERLSREEWGSPGLRGAGLAVRPGRPAARLPGDRLRGTRAQGEQFVEGGAERIDVAGFIENPAFSERLLGAHVAKRAQHVSGQGELGFARNAGHAEIRHPEASDLIDEQVGRFDIAVQNSVLVGVLERVGSLDSKPGCGTDKPLISGRRSRQTGRPRVCAGGLGFRARRSCSNSALLPGVGAKWPAITERVSSDTSLVGAGCGSSNSRISRMTSARVRPSMYCIA